MGWILHFIDLLIQLFVSLPCTILRNLLSSTLGRTPLPLIRAAPVEGVRTDDDAGGMRPILPTGGANPNISDELYQHCTSYESVTLLLAGDPTLMPGEAWKRLYGKNSRLTERKELARNGEMTPPPQNQTPADKIAACGKWGQQKPGELFLKMYGDALRTIDNKLDDAVVSPSLMGTNGTVPLTIISTIPDIARHMSNLIVRAEKEIILFTNYWQQSVAATIITNAFRELSRRAGQSGRKVVIKLMYDRGSPKQVFEPHYQVPERDFTDKQVDIPPLSEIPNLDLQVMNYHKPLLGTFHSKFMVVDRRIALVQSNNIQDNANLEMAAQFEGAVVDGIYDMALITWSKGLGSGLPLIDSPAATDQEALPSWTPSHERLFDEGGRLKGYSVIVDPDKMPWKVPFAWPEEKKKIEPETNGNGSVPVVNGHSASPTHDTNGDNDRTEGINGASPHNGDASHDTSEAGLDLPEHTHTDPHYDEDQASEILRVQASVTARPGEPLNAGITRHLNHTKSPEYVVPETHQPEDFPPGEAWTPYLPHPTHEPVPMAILNRPPYGSPNNRDLSNPQNAAWLSALRHAQHSVFIQSPTLNAEPLIPAIVEACERGVQVWCYVCLGYNDAGELLPGQGGHNELIAHKLATLLSPETRGNLHYFWYVAKDHSKPLVQWAGKRACHIKLLIADEQVGIVGSGNQDTQSWCHSQEANVMVDSRLVCRGWIDSIRRAQNTGRYGGLDPSDGVWRDADGKEVEGATGCDPGRFSWAKGVLGAVRRVQGKGGFG